METISRANISLTPIRIANAELIYNSINESREHLRTWLPFVDQTHAVEDTRAFIKSIYNSSCTKKDRIYEIWTAREFAGLIGFKEIDTFNHKAEVGYWLSEKMTGKGIMTQACILLIGIGFTNLNLNRLMIKVAIGNERSLTIPRRLNFKSEGIERAGELLHGRFVDLEVFSLLKSEWNEPRA